MRQFILKRFFQDFIELIYPDLCVKCKINLRSPEKCLCTSCLLHLPFTQFEKDPNNPVAKAFWGRIPVEQAMSLLFFHPQGVSQHLIHALKYQGRKDVGEFLGTLLASHLTHTSFNSVDLIVPVPLHPKKLKSRGFNQAEVVSYALAKELNKEHAPHLLKRVRHNATQTKKSRFARAVNTDGLFEFNQKKDVEGTHILVIDDVITSGSTLESCMLPLVDAGAKVSVATIAFSA